MKQIKLMKTKAGNGYKILADNEWVYASSKNVERLLKVLR
jgi:hypothetical protein